MLSSGGEDRCIVGGGVVGLAGGTVSRHAAVRYWCGGSVKVYSTMSDLHHRVQQYQGNPLLLITCP